MWNIYNQWECNIKVNEKKNYYSYHGLKMERVKNGTILFQLTHLIFRIDLNIMGIFLIFFYHENYTFNSLNGTRSTLVASAFDVHADTNNIKCSNYT